MSAPDLIAAIERYADAAKAHRDRGAELLAKFTLAELAALQDAIAAAIQIAAEEHPKVVQALWDVDLRRLEDAACALRQAHEALGEPDDRSVMQRLSGEQLGLWAV